MPDQEEPLVIVDLEEAPTDALIEELFNRFTSFVLIYEEAGKDAYNARNCIRRMGMDATCLGLIEYGRRLVSRDLDEYINNGHHE